MLKAGYRANCSRSSSVDTVKGVCATGEEKREEKRREGEGGIVSRDSTNAEKQRLTWLHSVIHI